MRRKVSATDYAQVSSANTAANEVSAIRATADGVTCFTT
jgi:hypothetical protein